MNVASILDIQDLERTQSLAKLLMIKPSLNADCVFIIVLSVT